MYRTQLGESLPCLSYLTKIDVFVLINFIFLIISAFRHALVFAYNRSDFKMDEDYQYPHTQLDRYTYLMLWTSYFLSNLLLFRRMCCGEKVAREKFIEDFPRLEKDYQVCVCVFARFNGTDFAALFRKWYG